MRSGSHSRADMFKLQQSQPLAVSWSKSADANPTHIDTTQGCDEHADTQEQMQC